MITKVLKALKQLCAFLRKTMIDTMKAIYHTL